MSNSNPVRVGRSRTREAVDAVVEDALFVVGEQRVTFGQLERAQKNIEALQEARRIERERLVAHIGHCKEDLRAAEEDLRAYDEIDAQCDDLHLEIMQTIVDGERFLDEGQRLISTDGAAAGFQHARQELLEQGAAGVLERRKRRLAAAQVSPTEAEAI